MSQRRRTTSIKPGRAPSFLGGIGSIIAIVFGIFWTVLAYGMTRNSPFGGVANIFPLFGVLSIVMGVVNAAYSFRQATQENRYSVLDITDSESEPDPLNERFGPRAEETVVRTTPDTDQNQNTRTDHQHRFCPYCGGDLGEGFRFCPSCGKELPE